MKHHFTAVVILITCAAPAAHVLGQSYHIPAKAWGPNPVHDNWICTSPMDPDRCYGDLTNDPRDTTIIRAYPVPEGDDATTASKIFWYTQGGSGKIVGGPGSHVFGDTWLVFQTDNTHAGRRFRGSSLTLRNDDARPGSPDRHWQLYSAFYDPDFSRYYTVSVVTPTGAPVKNGETIEFVAWESGDGINRLSTQTILKHDTTLFKYRFYDPALEPDPNNDQMWTGYFGWFDKGETSDGAARGRGITPFQVDWNSSTYTYRCQDGSWATASIGGQAPCIPWDSFPTIGIRVGGLSYDESGGWGEGFSPYNVGQSGIEDNPCPPGYPNGDATSVYTDNRNDHPNSSALRWVKFHPGTMSFEGPFNVTSSVIPLHGDYALNLWWAGGSYDWPGDLDFLYIGSADNFVCDFRWDADKPFAAGSGVYSLRVDLQ